MSRDPAADEIEALVLRLFPQASNNRFALLDWVKRFLDITNNLTPTQYARAYYLVHSLNLEPNLNERLAKLAVRLDEDGAYTDADIVSQALGKLE